MTVEITASDLSRAVAIARKNAPRWRFDDAYSAACFGLFRAAEVFDGRGTWEGFSGERMKWAVLDEMKRRVSDPYDPETWNEWPVKGEEDALPDNVEKALESLSNEHKDALWNGGTDRRYMGVTEALEALREAL